MKSKFTKTKKQKTIWIYISDDTKRQLKDIQIKYKCSMSSIIRACYLASFKYIKNLDLFTNQYFDESKKTASYIKPKLDLDVYQPFKDDNKMTKLFSNLAYIYTHKKLKEYFENKEAEKILSAINQDLQKSNEIYWDLNKIIRTQKRALSILGEIKK